MSIESKHSELPLAVFLPEGAPGYAMRIEIAKPKIARDGRVYTRLTVRPNRRRTPKWYLYAERPVDDAAVERAAELLRAFVAPGA